MIEEWRAIDAHPGYAVSNLGRVRGVKGDVLKPLMTTRYPRVVLTGRKYETIHRLVAAAFVGLAKGRQVNHIDGDRTNNAATNLEYCTGSENMKHAFRIGLQSNRGERHSQARLNDDMVREIRALLARGWKQSEVAAMMNVTPPTISRANSGKRWGHIINLGDEQAKNQLVAG